MTVIHTLRPGESPPDGDYAFIHRTPQGEWAVTGWRDRRHSQDLLISERPSYADYEEAKGVALHWAHETGAQTIYVQEEPLSIGTLG